MSCNKLRVQPWQRGFNCTPKPPFPHSKNLKESELGSETMALGEPTLPPSAEAMTYPTPRDRIKVTWHFGFSICYPTLHFPYASGSRAPKIIYLKIKKFRLQISYKQHCIPGAWQSPAPASLPAQPCPWPASWGWSCSHTPSLDLPPPVHPPP